MTGTKRIVVCFLLVAIFLGACSGTPDVPALTKPEELTTQTEIRTQRIFDEGPNWKHVIGGNAYFAVYDNKGNELYREENHRDPEFTEIGENLLKADVSGGIRSRITRFFEVEQGIYSPEYNNVLAVGYGRIAYLDDWQEGISSLVVHDMFDTESNRFMFKCQIKIDHIATYIESVEFINKNQLRIEYFNDQDKLMKETLDLEQ